MNFSNLSPGRFTVKALTKLVRHNLVGPDQQWVFSATPDTWTPSRLKQSSLYLHVPFCRNCCPYCPYTKVPYNEALVEPYTKAAVAEVDRWADGIGPTVITSVYIGGGTPTLAIDSVSRILDRVRKRFRLTGDICIETNPIDIHEGMVSKLQDLGIALISLGIQSFHPEHLKTLGRAYEPRVAERALQLLANSGFASVNADLMFALPGQSKCDLRADLRRVKELGANQITTYPLFTFPYTSVGNYLRLKALRMPNLWVRRSHYRTISHWSAENGFQRVSVWGFKRGSAPRYSSVTRDGYIGIGPGAGSQFSDTFVLNTFDLKSWIQAHETGRSAVSLHMPFSGEMSGWWWLYWRLYDTRIPLDQLDFRLGGDASKARRLLTLAELAGFAYQKDKYVELTEPGAFWLHLAQNHFALNYVNTLWTRSRKEAWPKSVKI